jgi:hypothetical protein
MKDITKDTEAIRKYLNFVKPKDMSFIEFKLDPIDKDRYWISFVYVFDILSYTFNRKDWSKKVIDDIRNFLGIRLLLMSSQEMTEEYYYESYKKDTQNEALKKLKNLIV